MNRNSLEYDSNTSSDGESDEIGSLTNNSSPPSNPSDSSLQSSQPNVGHSEQTRALEMRCKALEQKIQEDRARNEDELRRRDEDSKGVRETLRQIEALVKKRDEETAAVMQKRDAEVKALKEVVEVLQAADPRAHRLWQSQGFSTVRRTKWYYKTIHA